MKNNFKGIKNSTYSFKLRGTMKKIARKFPHEYVNYLPLQKGRTNSRILPPGPLDYFSSSNNLCISLPPLRCAQQSVIFLLGFEKEGTSSFISWHTYAVVYIRPSCKSFAYINAIKVKHSLYRHFQIVISICSA